VVVVEVTDASGDDEVDAEAVTVSEGRASVLEEGTDKGDAIESEDIEGEPDNNASDEIEAVDEMLLDGNGLLEILLAEETELDDEALEIGVVDTVEEGVDDGVIEDVGL